MRGILQDILKTIEKFGHGNPPMRLHCGTLPGTAMFAANQGVSRLTDGLTGRKREGPRTFAGARPSAVQT